MFIPPKFKLLTVLLAAAALLALPAAAQATLSFVRGPLAPAVYVANDNGSGVKKIGAGSTPHVSPDGKSIAYLHEGPGHAQELKLASAAGGPGRTLMAAWRESQTFAFSPDSTQIAALRGPELGKRTLVLIDVASGAQQTVASGYFNGVSFSPEGDELVYGRAASESYPPKTDLYRFAIASGQTARLTKDKRSQAPLWGPSGKIVFVKLLNADKRKYGPKSELYLINPNGKGLKRLTHTNVGALLIGLFPIEWSDNGNRLLAEFEGQDTSYAVAVNPRTGAQKALDKTQEQGFVGAALSGDGKTVLGFTGGLEPGPSQKVATVPYGGGKPKVLVRNGFEPDWSR